jgi:hypothetical protein
LRYYLVYVEPGWEFSALWQGKALLSPTTLLIFDKLQGAQAMRRDFLSKVDPSLLRDAQRQVVIRRNAVIDWGINDYSSKRVHSITLGCLRTR